MLTFKQHLDESIQINLARKAFSQLSHEAKNAIEDWESSNWNTGDLVKQVAANGPIAQELERAFAPIRATFKSKTIKLYRGVQQSEKFDQNSKSLYSWTLSRREAAYFAGLATRSGMVRHRQPLSDAEIEALYQKFAKTGYIKYRSHYYIRSKEHPDYYNIYDNSYSMVTDGYFPKDFKRTLKSDQEWDIEQKDKIETRGTVLERDIPVDKIVWITNNLGSLEFIVKK